jgi:hypothetical protein
MRSFLLAILSLGLLPLMSCHNSTGPSSPPQISVLLDANFDSAGHPSLSGFQDGYPTYAVLRASPSFSNDVPTKQAIRSLKISPPDSFSRVMHITLTPEQPTQWKQFRLVYWHKSFLKSFYDVQLGLWSGNTGYFFPSPKYSATWAQDTISYSANATPIDSVVIFLAMFAPSNIADTSDYTLFGGFKVEEFY